MNTNHNGDSGQGNRDSHNQNQDSQRMDGRGNPQRFEDNGGNFAKEEEFGVSTNNESREAQQRDDRNFGIRDAESGNARYNHGETDLEQTQTSRSNRSDDQNYPSHDAANFGRTDDSDFSTPTANFQNEDDDEVDDEDLDTIDFDDEDNDDFHADDETDVRPDRNF